MFCEKDVLKNLAKLTGRHLCRRLFILRDMCFPENFATFSRKPFFIEHKKNSLQLYQKRDSGTDVDFVKFLRTPFSIKHLWWLLLLLLMFRR